MPFFQADGLRFYGFDLLADSMIDHGVFTRHGGVSPEPWNSLNHGGTVGDSRENVIENRRRTFSAFDRPVEGIFDVWQVHGTKILCTDRPRPLNSPHREADGIATDTPGVTLFMRFADCVPLLFHDPVKRVVGIAHAGWKGTVRRIGAVMVAALQEQYGCSPENLLVGIGPSISVDRYQVGLEVVQQVFDSFGEDSNELIRSVPGGSTFDLWEANRLAVLEAGVKADHIQSANICTAENTQDWYSHRAERGKTGRFGVLMALK